MAATVLACLPATADARKNAWQVAALSGSYTYHAAAADPPACPDGRQENTVLGLDYSESFRLAHANSQTYAAKYFPFTHGPETNLRGQLLRLTHEGSERETYRVFDPNSDTCSSQDLACNGAQSRSQKLYAMEVDSLHRRRGRLRVLWHLFLGTTATECTPRGVNPVNTLRPVDLDVRPTGIDATTSVPIAAFRKRRLTLHAGGMLPVPAPGVLRDASITFHATVAFKKVVVRDGCKDTRPQRLFVCSL